MNGNILFIFEMIFLALLLLYLSKIGGAITNAIVLAPFIMLCFLAFKEIEPMLYMEKIISYNDWNGYNGIIVILALIFLGGISEIFIKIFGVKIKT